MHNFLAETIIGVLRVPMILSIHIQMIINERHIKIKRETINFGLGVLYKIWAFLLVRNSMEQQWYKSCDD